VKATFEVTGRDITELHRAIAERANKFAGDSGFAYELVDISPATPLIRAGSVIVTWQVEVTIEVAPSAD
jgi:hypothetical protein